MKKSLIAKILMKEKIFEKASPPRFKKAVIPNSVCSSFQFVTRTDFYTSFKNPTLSLQSEDLEKFDIFTERLAKEYDVHGNINLEEQQRIDMWNQIERLLSFLDYHYGPIPSFQSKELKSILYCLTKFICNQGLVKGEGIKKWIEGLNNKDYDSHLYNHFTL